MPVQNGSPDPSLIGRLADAIVLYRIPVLIGLAIIVAIFTSHLGDLKFDASLKGLLDTKDADTSTQDTFAILFESKNVLQKENLEFIHRVSQHFQNEPWVEHVDSLTTIPLPHHKKGPQTLDELDADIEAEEATPEVLDAVGHIVVSDPKRFPNGIASIPESRAAILVSPIIQGSHVTDDEAEALRSAVLDSAIVKGRLISNDGTLSLAALRLKGDVLRFDESSIALNQIQKFLSKNPPPRGLHVIFAGMPYLRSMMLDHMESDQLVLLPLTLIVSAVFLFLSFRWIPGVFLPLGTVILSTSCLLGGLAWAGKSISLFENIIPPLLTILGVSESTHLIARYLDEFAHNRNPEQAAHTTWTSLAVPSLITSVTTAAGFGSLVVSKTPMLRTFGLASAAGVMGAYLITILFIPTSVSLVRAPKHVPKRSAHRGWLEIGIVRFTAQILRRPLWTLTITFAFVAACGYTASHVTIDDAALDQFDRDDPVYQSARLIESKLDGFRSIDVHVRAEDVADLKNPAVLNAIDSVLNQIRKEQPAHILSVTWEGTLLHEALYQLSGDPTARKEPFRTQEQIQGLLSLLSHSGTTLADFTSSNPHHLKLQIRIKDLGAHATGNLIRRTKKLFTQALHGHKQIHFYFGGDAVWEARALNAVTHDLFSSLVTASTTIFILLILLLRSLRLAVLSILPNGAPLVVTLAYMVMRGTPLNTSTLIIFSVSLGLADYGTIHAMSRFQEELALGFSPHTALIRSARSTGRAILLSCVTLVCGFAVLLASSFVPIRRFGELMAITVIACLLSTLIMQPALLRAFGHGRIRIGKKSAGNDPKEKPSENPRDSVGA